MLLIRASIQGVRGNGMERDMTRGNDAMRGRVAGKLEGAA